MLLFFFLFIKSKMHVFLKIAGMHHFFSYWYKYNPYKYESKVESIHIALMLGSHTTMCYEIHIKLKIRLSLLWLGIFFTVALGCQKQNKLRKKKNSADWSLESDLIGTLCMACGILGLWHAPRNLQNVKFLSLSPSPLVSLSLQL